MFRPILGLGHSCQHAQAVFLCPPFWILAGADCTRGPLRDWFWRADRMAGPLISRCRSLLRAKKGEPKRAADAHRLRHRVGLEPIGFFLVNARELAAVALQA